MENTSNTRSQQTAVARSTEGVSDGSNKQVKATETKRSRGRPKGSRNRPKSLLPTELAGSILLQMKDVLPPDHYDYIRKVVREGHAVSAQREAQIMLLLLGRNLLPAILEETRKGGSPSDEEGEELYFRKDVTERLKVWNSILNIVREIEKRSDEGADSREKPFLQVFADSRIDPRRLEILLGVKSSGVGGNPDGTGRAAIETGTLSDQLPERQISVQDSEQVETIRILPADIGGDDSLGVHEEEL